MSRIGKKPIQIPEGVDVKIDGNQVKVKGPKGELSLNLPSVLKVELKDKDLICSPQKETKQTSALWGSHRALLANMIEGVSSGYQKQLEIEGVGYTAVLEDRDLVLKLGFSHPIRIKAPEGIKFKVERNTISVSGIDKALVGQVAAKIRAQRKPEPYKGKGIHYVGEVIRHKAGKKAIGLVE